MKAWWRILGLAAVVGGAVGCEPLEDIDFGGGGGAGGGGAFRSGAVFVRNGANGRDVYAVDDSGNANSPLRLTTEGGAYEPTVSRSGQLVAYVYRSGSAWEIRTVPTTGTGRASTVFANTNTAGCSGCANFHHPALSPTGNTIVLTLTRNSTSSLAKVNVDGTGFQVLASGTYVYGAPSFYPNGASVLVTAGFSAGQLNSLINVNVTTGASQVLTSSLGNSGAVSIASRAVVSPDGNRVAFDGQTNNGTQIFLGLLDGQTLSNVSQLTRHTGESNVRDTWPSWRGNTEVTFQSSAGGSDNLYRIGIGNVGAGTLVVPSVLEPSYGGA